MTNNCTKGGSTKGYPAVGSERAAVNFAIQGSGADLVTVAWFSRANCLGP